MPISLPTACARAVATVAACGALLTPTAAQADTVGGGLYLAVTAANGTQFRGVWLTCGTTGQNGSHPHAAASCRDLTIARGDLDALPGDPHNCTLQYAPVTATATGTWQGKPLRWQRTYPNDCVMDSETGPLFRI